MEPLLGIVVGGLVSLAVFAILRPNLIRLIIGFAILSNAVNLAIFALGRMTPGTPPLIPNDAQTIPPPFANPLPEALILTAIVIGFGLLAFTVALVFRAHHEFATLHPDQVSGQDSGGDP